MEIAAESYTKVVDMAPLHLEARLSLATLQQQLGRPEHALKALESMYDSETLAQDSSAAQKVWTCHSQQQISLCSFSEAFYLFHNSYKFRVYHSIFGFILQKTYHVFLLVLLRDHTYQSTERKQMLQYCELE